MKTIFKLSFVSALLIAGETLFAVSINDMSNVNADQQNTVEETSYSMKYDRNLEKAIETLHKAEIALDNIMENPEKSIPASLISQSEGIVIFPRALKIAICGVGGQGARGIAMIRLEDGSWSNPFFVSLGEASLGIQFGAQKSDIVLLFKDKYDVLSIEESEMTLGTDVGITAGQSSNGSMATSDITFESEIYSYSVSNGFFAGVSLKGGILSYNQDVNDSLYGIGVKAEDILNAIETPYNDEVNVLIEEIAMYEE